MIILPELVSFPIQFHNLLLASAGLLGLFVLYNLIRGIIHSRSSLSATRLHGPPRRSWIRGYQMEYIASVDGAALYEEWGNQYGSTFEVPWGMGKRRIVLADPQAVAHFYARESTLYVGNPMSRAFFAALFGKGVLWAEGDVHKRQRKALTPAFSNAAIRRVTPVFYDSVYKLKTFWEAALESSPGDSTVIDVQKWMNRIALDSIGIAGFSNDFRTLEDTQPPVERALESMGAGPRRNPIMPFIFLLGSISPTIANFMVPRRGPFSEVSASLNKVAEELLARHRKSGDKSVDEKSVIGLLIKAETTDRELYLTKEEVVAQMNVLLLAGYATTSISLTWALIELSRNPSIQTRLREEVQAYVRINGNSDPTYEHLHSQAALPYLDAVVHEVLRMHSPVIETMRQASQDDIIPLGSPIQDRNGKTIDSIVVKKGDLVTAPIRYINRSTEFWGEDAKTFRPERWLELASGSNTVKATELAGHRHLLSFSDGPRHCLGKNFALTEFKSVLFVLIRNYTFEFPDGPETTIVKHMAFLPRPKVEGKVLAEVPLTVRRVES